MSLHQEPEDPRTEYGPEWVHGSDEESMANEAGNIIEVPIEDQGPEYDKYLPSHYNRATERDY